MTEKGLKYLSDILQAIELIVGFRNRLIHAYDAVDSSMIWAILKKHLGPLKEEVSKKVI